VLPRHGLDCPYHLPGRPFGLARMERNGRTDVKAPPAPGIIRDVVGEETVNVPAGVLQRHDSATRASLPTATGQRPDMGSPALQRQAGLDGLHERVGLGDLVRSDRLYDEMEFHSFTARLKSQDHAG